MAAVLWSNDQSSLQRTSTRLKGKQLNPFADFECKTFPLKIGNKLWRTRPKSLEWCASLIRSLYWLIRLIWIGFLDLWIDWTDLVYLIGWLKDWNDITPETKYVMVEDFMRYYNRITISHGCRFYEILHQNQNISWFQISWDITPESKYLMAADFMRYIIKIKISHGCIFREILHQNQNISWLRISWDIWSESKYLMVADLVRYYSRTTISHGCRINEILLQNHNI